MNRITKQDQKSLVLWATDCAKHVLPYFEKEYPQDDRPRKAIEAGRAWMCGKILVSEARIAAFAAHVAARDADYDAARAAARAAGHAAATAHVASHAFYAVAYAISTVEVVNVSTFTQRVYRVVARIPKGKVLSYKEVAIRAGSPKACRAVGNIMNRHNVKGLPCHRVIASNGKIGGYRWGIKKKLAILKKEGVRFNKK